MDFIKYQNLHTILMLNELIRKWWRLELSFADEHGTVGEWNQKRSRHSSNELCRTSMSAEEGRRRCSQAIRVLHEGFLKNRKLRRCQTYECHLQFQIVAAPLYVNNVYRGMLYVEGFLRQASTAQQDDARIQALQEFASPCDSLQSALSSIPVLSQQEFEKLADLLEFAVDDIAAYESQLNSKDARIQSLSSELSGRYRFENLIGKSGPMLEVFRLLEKVCHSESTVLINGESGTGKELVARAIHYNGPRKDKPFVVQNCSALNDNLLESALFGHLKGSFTGALRDTKGLFEVADGGTFFLDEIGDMSPSLQVKLLRVLQEGTFMPVGGTQNREVNVRVIAATHKNLADLVKQGRFREDLYYRINVIRIHLPSLRERQDDIPVLIEHFMKKHRGTEGRPRGLSSDAMAILCRHSWPGNIRELENEIERLLVLGSDLEFIPGDLISSRIREASHWPPSAPLLPTAAHLGKLSDAVEALERGILEAGLSRTRHNKSRLARELGISRSNLILKIAKYGLEPHGSETQDSEEVSH